MSHLARAKDLGVLFAIVASAGLAFQPSRPPVDLILFGRVYTRTRSSHGVDELRRMTLTQTGATIGGTLR